MPVPKAFGGRIRAGVEGALQGSGVCWSQEQSPFTVTPVTAAETAWCHQGQPESSLGGKCRGKGQGLTQRGRAAGHS